MHVGYLVHSFSGDMHHIAIVPLQLVARRPESVSAFRYFSRVKARSPLIQDLILEQCTIYFCAMSHGQLFDDDESCLVRLRLRVMLHCCTSYCRIGFAAAGISVVSRGLYGYTMALKQLQ